MSDIPPPYSKSEEVEIAEGRKIHDAIVATQYLYTKEDVVAYVETVGKRLAEFSPRRHLPYEFSILVDERVYSTSAPGGFIYITTGLLNFLENEAELAGILAHEIGQAQYQLPIFSAFKKRSEDLSALAAVVAPLFGPIGVLSAMGMIFMSSMSFEKPEEDRLAMADKYAVKMMLQAGYDPQGLLDVFYRFLDVDAASSGLFYDWSQKRPVTAARIENLREKFGQLNVENLELMVGRAEYESVMASVRGIYAGH